MRDVGSQEVGLVLVHQSLSEPLSDLGYPGMEVLTANLGKMLTSTNATSLLLEY